MLNFESFLFLFAKLSSILYFASPYIFTYEMIKGKKEVKNFPLKILLIKLIGSSLVFSYLYVFIRTVIRSNATPDHYDITFMSLSEISYFGIIISLIFLFFYGFYYLQIETKMKIIYLLAGMVGYGFIMILIILINYIRFLKSLLFLIGYTGIIISPFHEFKDIYYKKDHSLIPKYDVHLVVFMAFFIGFLNKNLKNKWDLFTIEINLVFSICEIGIYYYLIYNSNLKGENQEENNKIDENLLNNNTPSSNQIDLNDKNNENNQTPNVGNQMLNNPINDSNNNNDNNQLPVLNDILKNNNI
jgi:hypothetical protein